MVETITRTLPAYEMRSPLFGVCNLIPRDIDEEPGGVGMGYVVLDGAPDQLLLAIYKGGGWHDYRLKPFAKEVVAWFSVEKPDGSPIL